MPTRAALARYHAASRSTSVLLPAPGAPVDLNHLVDNGFSGNPLGMVISKPDFSPRPWIYIADSLKMRLASSAFQPPLQWGVSPPNDPPTAALAAANPNGPDIGATGTPYLYRYRGRKASDVSTGAYGNAGPPMRPFDAAGNPAGIVNQGELRSSMGGQEYREWITTSVCSAGCRKLDPFWGLCARPTVRHEAKGRLCGLTLRSRSLARWESRSEVADPLAKHASCF